MTAGWKLDVVERRTLLSQLIPIWPDVIADHVTLESGQEEGAAV